MFFPGLMESVRWWQREEESKRKIPNTSLKGSYLLILAFSLMYMLFLNYRFKRRKLKSVTGKVKKAELVGKSEAKTILNELYTQKRLIKTSATHFQKRKVDDKSATRPEKFNSFVAEACAGLLDIKILALRSVRD